MFVKHIDHLNLTVHNLEKTIQWYSDVFGFEVVEREVRLGVPFAVIRAGDALLCIYEYSDYVYSRASDDGRHGIAHFSFRVTDRQRWLKTVEDHKIPWDYGTGEIRYPHSSSWYVADPTGYQIEVVLWDEDTISFD